MTSSTPPSSPSQIMTCKTFPATTIGSNNGKNVLRAESIRALSLRLEQLKQQSASTTSSLRSLDELASELEKQNNATTLLDSETDSDTSSLEGGASSGSCTVEDESTHTSEDRSSTSASANKATTTTTTTPSIVAPVNTNEQVRSKLLHRLGIPGAPSSAKSPMPERNPPLLHHEQRRRKQVGESYELPLNGDDFEPEKPKAPLRRSSFSFFSQKSSVSEQEEEEETKEGSQHNDDASQQDRAETDASVPPPPPPLKKSVRFVRTVQAHPIPSHRVYSSRLKATIWTGAEELQENVARNCLEFSAENWDWHQVVDDEHMIYYHGQKIHPVHFADQ